MMISLAFLFSWYAVAVASESVPDEDNVIRIVSVKQVGGRQLQMDPGVSCSFEPHGQAISCVEQTSGSNNVKYSVSCPAGVTIVDECLQDQKRICYRFDTRPCIGAFFCAATNRFALDCGNLFAQSNGNTCSRTDCDLNCAQIRDVPVDYNTVPLDNDCFRLGLSSTTSTEGAVTTEWTHVLSDSNEIQVTGTRNAAASVFSTCQVTVRGQAGSSCPCRVDCAPQVNAISYDCSDFSNDACAAIDCSGNCLPNGFPSPVAVSAPVNPPVAAPVAPPVAAPVTPPVSPPVAAPVTPPVAAPVTPPMAAPVTPPMAVPVTPPVAAPAIPPLFVPVTPPVAAPVTPPVAAPVTPPVATPVTPPVAVPATPPLFMPVTLPVAAPVTQPASPPLLSPVGIVTSPPVMRPMTPSNNATICPVWWGLY